MGQIQEMISMACLAAFKNRRSIVLLTTIGLLLLSPSALTGLNDTFLVFFAFLLIGLGLPIIGLFSRRLYAIACVTIIALSLVHLHIEYHWGGDQLDARIEAFMESPTSESIEYFQSHLGLYDLALMITGILALSLVIMSMRVNLLNRKQLRVFGAIAATVWVAMFFGIVTNLSITRLPLISLPYQYFAAKKRYEDLSIRSENLRDSLLPIDNCSKQYKKIVIVIGESMITDHLSAFGYPKKTTPFIELSNPMKIPSIAPSNQTRFAIAMLLTDADPENFDLFYRAHSIAAEFRACGYHTVWISNQGKLGKFDNFSTVLARETDEQFFLNQLSYLEAKVDGEVVNWIKKLGMHRRERTVTFLHLIGSHTKYGKRYPPGFGFEEIGGVVDAYDNSILYTDAVLSQIYELFYDDETLIVYVSDHGQVVTEMRHGSGFNPAYKEEYRTPVLIWTEDRKALEAIRVNLGSKFLNTASFPNLVRFLVGKIDSPSLSTSERILALGTKRPSLRQYGELGSFMRTK